MTIEKTYTVTPRWIDFTHLAENPTDNLYLTAILFSIRKLSLAKEEDETREILFNSRYDYFEDNLKRALLHLESKITASSKVRLQTTKPKGKELVSLLNTIESLEELVYYYGRILGFHLNSEENFRSDDNYVSEVGYFYLILAIAKITFPDDNPMKIYIPFAGYSTLIGFHLGDYYSQEIDETKWALGVVRLFLLGLPTSTHFLEDSVSEWKGFDCFDLITSTTTSPFNSKIIYSTSEKNNFATLYLKRLSETSTPSISIMEISILSDSSHKEIRKKLIEKDAVEMIILIPMNFHTNKKEQALLFINPNKKDTGKINFVDGRNLEIGRISLNGFLDFDENIKQIISDESKHSRKIDLESVVEENYSLHPKRYVYEMLELPPFSSYSKSLLEFIDILEFDSLNIDSPHKQPIIWTKKSLSEKINSSTLGENENEDFLCLDSFNFSDNPLGEKMPSLKYNSTEITNMFREDETLKNNALFYCKIKKEDVIVRIEDWGKGFEFTNIEKGGLCFGYSQNLKVFRLKNPGLTPDYLRIILKNKFVTSQFNRFCDEFSKTSPENSDLLRIEIPMCSIEEQKVFVEQYKSNRLKQEKANLDLIEMTANLSHQIGVPKNRIMNTISKLEKKELSDEIRADLVKIKNNFIYINRVINFNGQPVDKLSGFMKAIKTRKLLQEYILEWKDVYGGVFEIVLDFPEKYDYQIHSDEDILKVMWDAIFENTVKHAFEQKRRDGQKLLIEVDEVTLNEKIHLLFSFSNNGKSPASTFSTQNFIELGRREGKTGNTGQGGAQINDLARLMEGKIEVKVKKNNPDGLTFMLNIYIPTKNKRNE